MLPEMSRIKTVLLGGFSWTILKSGMFSFAGLDPGQNIKVDDKSPSHVTTDPFYTIPIESGGPSMQYQETA